MNEKQTHSFFNGRGIGRNLKEVSADLVKNENKDIMSRWFHSEPGTDLFTWTDQQHNIIKQQISFNGQVVEWNCLDGIKTGVVIESDLQISGDQGLEEQNNENQIAKENAKSETIQFDENPQKRSVGLALEILRYMEGDSQLLGQIIGNFENPQNIKTMKPEDFISRFGNALKKQRKKESFWSFWKRYMQDLLKF
ncbi:MAG: hypothetical protein SGI74_12725 [Oligoflexia bacterium]|nr:hypothetical protein [Oligoflexia bacterium]